MARRPTRIEAERPIRQLLSDLRKLEAGPADTAKTGVSALLNRRMAQNAETVMAICHHGLAALGLLLAHSSPVIEDGTVGADSVEALGWLMAEIGDLASACAVLSSECRAPPAPENLLKL